MATSPDYLAFILDLCQQDQRVTSRAMMGEYLLYYQGKLVGGLYDNRLLVKPVAPGHYEAYDATNAFYQACGYEAIEVFPDLWDEWNPCLLRLKYLKTN